MRKIVVVLVAFVTGCGFAQTLFAKGFVNDMAIRMDMVQIDCPSWIIASQNAANAKAMNPVTYEMTTCYTYDHDFSGFKTLWADNMMLREDDGKKNPTAFSPWQFTDSTDANGPFYSRGYNKDQEGFLLSYFPKTQMVVDMVIHY